MDAPGPGCPGQADSGGLAQGSERVETGLEQVDLQELGGSAVQHPTRIHRGACVAEAKKHAEELFHGSDRTKPLCPAIVAGMNQRSRSGEAFLSRFGMERHPAVSIGHNDTTGGDDG